MLAIVVNKLAEFSCKLGVCEEVADQDRVVAWVEKLVNVNQGRGQGKLTFHDDTHGDHQTPENSHGVCADGFAGREVVCGIAGGLGACLDDAVRFAGGDLKLRRRSELLVGDLDMAVAGDLMMRRRRMRRKCLGDERENSFKDRAVLASFIETFPPTQSLFDDGPSLGPTTTNTPSAFAPEYSIPP